MHFISTEILSLKVSKVSIGGGLGATIDVEPIDVEPIDAEPIDVEPIDAEPPTSRP
jgi:hypothetical protein